MINKLLFFLAKTKLIGSFIGICFEYLSDFIPVNRITETNFTLAFYHPKPSWENHIVIVPKKKIPTFLHFPNENNSLYLLDILFSARDVISKLEFKTDLCNLCVNGGLRQEVQIVHFHLFTEVPPINLLANCININFNYNTIYESSTAKVFYHPKPSWEIHIVIVFEEPLSLLSFSTTTNKLLYQDFINVVHRLNQKIKLEKIGYTLFFNEMLEKTNNYSACHIVAGNKIN